MVGHQRLNRVRHPRCMGFIPATDACVVPLGKPIVHDYRVGALHIGQRVAAVEPSHGRGQLRHLRNGCPALVWAERLQH